MNEEKAINTGKAAHITAAAPGGARYDTALSAEERRSASNGIWLCSYCADLIDKDSARYTVDLLKRWKKDTEADASMAIATHPNAALPIIRKILIDESDKDFLQRLALPPEDDIESITIKMHASALHDIATFHNTSTWPPYTINLNLTLHSSNDRANVFLEGLAKAVFVTERTYLVSSPGTGKTTTLVQLAEYILNVDQSIAVVVPLGEWSDRSETLFNYLLTRNAFRLFKPEHFMQLAYYGRLVLLLDGWNELNPTARIRAERELASLRREYMLLAIVISTRRQDIPTKGVYIEIEALSETQQIDLAYKLRGEEGKALVDQAWRIPSLRELITIPLYLNALLCSTPTSKLPETKEEILSIFVGEHYKAPEKIEILRRELLGFHNDILIGLAADANNKSSATLTNADALRTISQVVQSLLDDQQLTNALQSVKVLDVLVDTHLLIRSHNGENISFQHQQFQEWYASFRVEKSMRESFQGNLEARTALRTEILNWFAWEESILFACERLSRGDHSGVQAVAAAIILTLGIDPMLAAEMIYRSTEDVWTHIRNKVELFITDWHKPGKIDRAVHFMIKSGRHEFSEYIWPFITNSDSQIHLAIMRAAHPFRPSVLGPDAKKRLAKLPEDIRCSVIAEIGQGSSIDGIELATDLAKNDQSPQVVVEILESLAFRRADRHVKDILQTASDKVWDLITRKGYPDKFLDPTHSTKFAAMRQTLISNETDPIKMINHLTEDGIAKVGAADHIEQLIQSPDFPVNNDYSDVAIENAYKIYPQAVTAAILQRIINFLPLPYRANEYIQNTLPVDDGPIAAMALDEKTPPKIARVAYTIIGPSTVGNIMDKFMELYEKFRSNGSRLDKAETDEYHRLSTAINLSRQTSFLTALFERSHTNQINRIGIMAELLAQHGKSFKDKLLIVSEDITKQLIGTLKRWAKLALKSSSTTQQQFSNITRAMGRLSSTEFVDDLQKMLVRELDGLTKTHDNYTQHYRKAFAVIGDNQTIALMKNYLPDIRFGFNAASVLMDIWNQKNVSDDKKHFFIWHNFSNVKEHRKLLYGALPPPTSDFAEAIFDVVKQLGSTNDPDKQKHALTLAEIGFALPHGLKETEIKMLCALPQKFANKQKLLAAAAIAGEIIPVDILFAGLEELLGDAEKASWRLDENRGELMGWIELFAFSDQPLDVIEAINLLPATHRHPWQMDRILSALGNSPHQQALETLEGIALDNPEIVKQHAWLRGIIDVETEASSHTFLNLICDGKVLKNSSFTMWELSKQLAYQAVKFPSLTDKILQSYEKMTDQKQKVILEKALIDLSNVTIILRLIRCHASNNQPYNYILSEAIRKIAIGQRQISDWPGAFEQFSIPLAELRKQLFDVFVADDDQSRLAEACLVTIDELRDEYGYVSDEPRHPDILSKRPWPKEAPS